MKVEEILRKAEQLAQKATELDIYQLGKIEGYIECMIATKKLKELEEESKEPA